MKRSIRIENGLPKGTPNLLPVTLWWDSSQGGHLVVKRSISIENCFPGANVAGAEPVSPQGDHVVMKRSILTENGHPGGTPRPEQVTVLRAAPGEANWS